ncbi:threonine/serine exporter family protein [Sporolactobacillus putidus]|uniref:Membrane protein n=1 Tax=Sporolactobacillus putidus TaxID=492735 RepID=A0A917SBS4_9BACL|nr:threonine/serine exporter family protein [Sporolactobacillus putidus]GGL65573.1 membrane protein [Sporolactobacillus putidus]
MNGFQGSYSMNENKTGFAHEVAAICVLAGKILLQNGAETFRVEDTMNRIARNFSVNEAQSFVTPTGIIFSIEDRDVTQLVRITHRGTNLRKVTQVNSLSRLIAEGELGLSEAYRRLKEIERSDHVYPNWIQIVAAAAASSCFLLMFLGKWEDALPAFIAGGVGQAGTIYFHRLTKVKFFSEFMSSILIGLIAVLSVKIGAGSELNKIIIGAVMPLVPGVAITNAVRDVMAGDLVSGLSKSAEAGLTAFAVGIGIALALSFN